MRMIRNKVFAKRLKELCEYLHISQSELAKRIGVTRQTVNYWINAKTTPSFESLCSIAELLGCSKAYLLGYEDYAFADYISDKPKAKNQSDRYLKHFFERR